MRADTLAFGATYGEWSARWWQWVFAIERSVNPLLDTTGVNCGQGQSGDVWFLAGTTGGGPVTRSCTIPAGKGIFFPVVNIAVNANWKTDTVNDLCSMTAGAIDTVTNLKVTIDGFSVKGLYDLRAKSPVFSFTAPEHAVFYDNLCSYPDDPSIELVPPVLHDSGQMQICPLAVSDGYWVMLPPLRPGPHILKFSGAGGWWTVDVTYNLTIAP